jgi:hypothetical protein
MKRTKEEQRAVDRARMRCQREKWRADPTKRPKSPTKVCPRCSAEKPATPEVFGHRSLTFDGLNSHCLECEKERLKRRRPDRTRYQRERRRANPEKFRQAARQRRIDHPELTRAQWRAYQKRWKAKNPRNRVRVAISVCITRSIKTGKYTTWSKLVGYSLVDLVAHLEARFAPGMTWDNYGLRGWHIGHRKPVSSFTFTTPTDAEFRACWALSNLFPQWAAENQSAGARREFPAAEHVTATLAPRS